MNENMEQRRKFRQVSHAKEVLESYGYVVVDPDEDERPPDPPNGPDFGLSEERTEEVIRRLHRLHDHINTRTGMPFPYLDTLDRLRDIISFIRST